MKVYISGPMSGLPNFNIKAFDALAVRLRNLGHEVVSPAELDDPAFRSACMATEGRIDELRALCERDDIEPATWGDLLARDVKLLADDGVRGIVVLDGWERSRGALLELFVGRLCNLPIFVLDHDTLRPVALDKILSAHKNAAGYIHPLNTTLYHPIGEGSPKDPKDWVLLDTAESVQADAETRVVDPDTGGEKGLKDEVEGDICPKALIQVARVCGFGRKKYSRANYLKGYAWSSSYDAMQRHLKAFWAGEEINDESGIHHLAHGAWHALALLAFVIRKVGKDDRI
jgi:hypothetical protein